MNKIIIIIFILILGTALIYITNDNTVSIDTAFLQVEVNNKNLALPDLTGKQEITSGTYRIYNLNGITMDYNIYYGEYIINGTTTNYNNYLFINITPNTKYYYTYYALSGNIIGGQFNMYASTPVSVIFIQQNTNQNVSKLLDITTQTQVFIEVIPISQTVTFNNYTFKIQLEKGQTPTSYVVPKKQLVYIDNLTPEQKQEIGTSGISGVTKIITTINDVIDTVSNFVNGIINIFR